jgi:hypothetical protein
MSRDKDGLSGFGNFRLVGLKAYNGLADGIRIWRFQRLNIYGQSCEL